MRHRMSGPALALCMIVTAIVATPAALFAWPPWLSIESPVNPFDPTTRGALLLVHAAKRESAVTLAELTASAEGIVRGERRSIPLVLDSTNRPGVFALRQQWPAEGRWVVRVTLDDRATALVTFGPSGEVASVRVPTESTRGGLRIPRAVAPREIDSTLSARATP